MEQAICNVDITRESGRSAHAIVRFPRSMRSSAQMNMLLLQHDAAGTRFAAAVVEAEQRRGMRLYAEAFQ